MRVLVTGGRTFNEREWLWAALDFLHTHPQLGPITEVIEGGAPGADVRAGEWAYHRELRLTVCPARWEQHGRSAGYIRNAEMAKLKPDVVLACPGGKGTANMVEVAKAHGLKVIQLEKLPVAKATKRGALTGERPIPGIIESTVTR